MTDRIGEPYELLSLPKPFGGRSSQTQAKPVWQYSSTRIRLRSEVVVAVDGEGLYIYDIENPRLVTSYAVPPETRFICPPTSLIRKRADHKLERVTYAAVQLRDSQKHRLLCFAEERKKQPASEIQQPAWKQLEADLPGTDLSICSLLAVPVDLSDVNLAKALHLTVVYERNTIESYAGDLSHRHFIYKREAPKHKQYVHEYATTLSLKTLRRGLLRERQDVIATLEDSGIDADLPNIILIVRADSNAQKDETDRSLLLGRLTGSTSIDEPGKSLKRHGLIKVQRLPRSIGPEATGFQLSSDGLQLSAQTGGSLRVFDLRDQDLGASSFTQSDLVTHLNLGQSEILACSAETCKLHNVQWHATRAELQVANVETKSGNKRGLDTTVPALSTLHLVHNFSNANLAVGLTPGALVGLPLDRSVTAKKRRVEMTLAESVGKGQASLAEQADSTLAAFSTQVRELVESNQVSELEAVIGREIGLSGTKEDSNPERINGRDGAVQTAWTFPKDCAALLRRTDLAKARAVLRECIGIDHEDPHAPVYLRLYSDMIFRWLAISGVLSWLHYDQQQTGVLMTSLAEYDSTLATMETVLRWDFFLDVSEVVQALSIAIDSLDSPIPHTEQITDVPTNGEVNDQPDDESVADATQAAEDDLAFAIASLNHGTAIRSGLLKSIFDRLFAFPSKDIIGTFKTMLTSRELVFLINLLRIELADGGWTTRYTDERYEDDMDDSPADSSISIIIKVLNSAIDAVGPTGWNVGLSSDKQLNTDEMLLVLRAEVNAALDGCQEYQAIAASLQEFTKFCALAGPLSHRKKKKQVDPVRNPGFVKEDAEDVLLPLGARLDMIEKARVSKGGRVDIKSKNQMGQEISMRVGQYSIDKIRV